MEESDAILKFSQARLDMMSGLYNTERFRDFSETFTEDCVYMAQNYEIIFGRKGVEDFARGFNKTGTTRYEPVVEESVPCRDDLVIDRGRTTSRDGRGEVVSYIKWLLVREKKGDQWLNRMFIWNRDAPLHVLEAACIKFT